jgi:FAD/FMN-containing dehydrogenase
MPGNSEPAPRSTGAALLLSHEAEVARVAREIRERVADGRPVRIAKGGVSHFVPLPGDPRGLAAPIDISVLNRILEIDVAAGRCTAEPGVTFADLLKETLKFGLMPTVVPELEGITAGGAVAGCSVESASYRYGGFHDSCLEYEIVSGEGEVVTCSRTRDPLLFEMIHGSYGTLGALTKLSFLLVPAEPFVRMEYRRFRTFEAFNAELRERCRQGDYDFVDGIIHGPDKFVVCLGQKVSSAPYVSNYRWLNIYYESTSRRTEDYLTTFDYCFRYDTECHWLTKRVPLMTWKPARFLVGKQVLGSTNLIRWSKRVEPLLGLRKRPDVVCDVFIPARRFQDFYTWYERTFNFFPLWIVPYRMSKPYGWISDAHGAKMADELFFDCAVYGKPNEEPGIDYSELIERKTYELDGVKTLISRNHYSRDQFWEIYDKPRYDAAKGRLDPRGVFGDLYEKCHRMKAPRAGEETAREPGDKGRRAVPHPA